MSTEIPPQSDADVRETLEERTARVGEIELAYEVRGEPSDPALVLIMGLGTQMIHWDSEFCDLLVSRGFRVVRFDNRDSGRSTVLSDRGTPDRVSMLLGLPIGLRYQLTDMADDAAGLLDHLGIERAHLVGASMGGMIAQTLAIHHPERALSLCSMISRTGARLDAPPSPKAMRVILSKPPRDKDAYLEQALVTAGVIGSPAYPADPEGVREIAGWAFERGFHPDGTARQIHAINASPNRGRALRRLDLPTVVIHGDRDPLVHLRGGRATARAIPGARMRIFEGMGHDLPRPLWGAFANEIESNAARAR